MISIVLGRRSLGKSTLAYHLARDPERPRKRLILDPRRNVRRLDVEIITRADELPEALDVLQHDRALNEVVLQPIDEDLDAEFLSWTRTINAFIVAHPRVPLVVVYDEASFYPLLEPPFTWLCKCTDVDTIHVILTSHRPTHEEIPTVIQSIADDFYLFGVTQHQDLKRIADRCGHRTAKLVRELTGREYVHWNDSQKELTVCTDPRSWHVGMRQVESAPPRAYLRRVQ